MGTVTTTFTGDPTKLLADYNKLYAANVKYQQGLAGIGAQAKKNHGEIKGYLEEQAKGVKGMVASYFTVEAGVHAVKEAHGEWLAKVNQLVERSKAHNQELMRSLALSGQLANAGQISAGLKNIPGVKGGDALSAFGGVTAGAPLVSDPTRLLDLATGAASIAKTGSGIDLAQFGQLVGEVSTLDPKRGGSDVADLALTVMQKLGKNFEKFQSSKQFGPVRGLIDTGLYSTEQALALSAQAAAQDMPALPGDLLEGLTKQFDKPETKGRLRLTDKERAQMALFQSTSPADRLQLLMNDPEARRLAMGDTGAAAFDRLDSGSWRQLTGGFQSATGARERMERDLAATRGGRALASEYEGQYAQGRADRGLGATGRAEELNRARELLELHSSEQGSNWLTKWGRAKLFGFDTAMQSIRGSVPSLMNERDRALKGTDTIPIALQNRGGDALMSRFIEETNRVEGYEKYDPQGRLTVEAVNRAAEETKKLRQEVERQGVERRSDRRTGAAVDPIKER